MVCLGEGGKVGVILDINSKTKIFFQLFGDVEIVPVEIAKPDGDVALNNARHGDGARFNTRHAEIDANLLAEVLVELVLVLDSGEFDRM